MIMRNYKCLLIRFNRLYSLLLYLCFFCYSVNAFSSVESPTGYFSKGMNSAQWESVSAYCQSIVPSGWSSNGNVTYNNTSGWIYSGSLAGGHEGYQPPGSSEFGCNIKNDETGQIINGYGDHLYLYNYCLLGEVLNNPNTSGYLSCETCPSGFIDQGGQCVPGTPPPDCPSAGTKAAASLGWITTGDVSTGLSVADSLCTNNSPTGDLCQARCDSGVVARNSVTGESRLECSSYTFTGSLCVPTDKSAVLSPVPDIGENGNGGVPPKNPEDCPPGTGFAQINNINSCLPSGSEYTSGSSTSTDTTTQTTKTSITTINPDGTTTTTTTTNVTNVSTGGTIGSGTTSSTGSMNKADGGGTGKNSNQDDVGPVPLVDTSLPEEGNFTVRTIPTPVFDTQLFNVSGSCPEPITYDVMGKTFSIDFQPICDYAPIVRGIMLLLAAVVSIRMVVTK